MKKRYLGCHVSAAGGLVNAALAARKFELNTIQLHPSPPQRWNYKPYPPKFEEDFMRERQDSLLEHVFFHAIYLINLANPDPVQAQNSRTSLTHYLTLNALVNGSGVIVHVGSMKDEPDEKIGYKRAAESINRIMEAVPRNAKLLLEVAAGSGAIIGDRVEELAEIYDMVERKEQVGFALDSQHLWASGYDLKSNLNEVVKNITDVFTIEKIGAIHLNDSKTELASRKDRHENLGDGLIGMEALTAFVNHPAFVNIPFILETPNMKNEEGIQIEIDKLRKMAG